MLWLCHNYLPDEQDWTKWDAPPLFAPDDLVSKTPKAWTGYFARRYGEKLKSVGVEVETEVYKGAPHPSMAMDGKSSFCLLVNQIGDFDIGLSEYRVRLFNSEHYILFYTDFIVSG